MLEIVLEAKIEHKSLGRNVALNPEDPLDEFLEEVFSLGSVIGEIPLMEAVRNTYGVYGVTYYRSGQFQVQLFVTPPNYLIPEHTHPDVDSYEVYLGGQLMFSHSGKWVLQGGVMDDPDEYGLCKARGYVIRVKPSDLHGAAIGPAGGVFLSVQRWLNGVKPTCVGNNYEGIGVHEGHKAEVGNVTFKELSWRDCASKEEEAPIWIK